MNTNRKAFTLVELLTVIAIIALLLSLAVPALNEARIQARETADRASLNAISTAIETFAGEVGDYPESAQRVAMTNWDEAPDASLLDSGAHRLFEALAGHDLFGYQKDSYYRLNPSDHIPEEPSLTDPSGFTQTKRWGPYIKLETVQVGDMGIGGIGDDRLCAHRDSVTFGPGGNSPNPNPVFLSTSSPGLPRAILYYKANLSMFKITDVYNYNDNAQITQDVESNSGLPFHPGLDEDGNLPEFYPYILDTRTGVFDYTQPGARPYNNDSFILINAGRDGMYGRPPREDGYGLSDDIKNF